jgi:hypothetical protein
LALVGVQQDRAAASARIIHRLIARYKHRRSIQNDTSCWRGDCFKADYLIAVGHARSLLSGGSTTLSATAPGHRAAVGDAKTMRRSQWKRQPFQMAQAATTALSSALSLVSVAGGQGRPRPEKPVSLIHQSRVTISRRDQYLTAPEPWAMGYSQVRWNWCRGIASVS